jgi:hypothetical protein
VAPLSWSSIKVNMHFSVYSNAAVVALAIIVPATSSRLYTDSIIASYIPCVHKLLPSDIWCISFFDTPVFLRMSIIQQLSTKPAVSKHAVKNTYEVIRINVDDGASSPRGGGDTNPNSNTLLVRITTAINANRIPIYDLVALDIFLDFERYVRLTKLNFHLFI